MNAKQIAGLVFCVLAAVLVVRGILVVSDPPELEGPSSVIVSYSVGAFLPALVALTIGVWLLRKPKPPE